LGSLTRSPRPEACDNCGMMSARLACGAALLVLYGCDPGLSYQIAGATQVKDDGNRYVVDLGEGVLARFYSGVSITDGEVEIEVLNRADAPLSFVPAPPVVSNGEGKTLKPSNCMYQILTSQTTGMDAQANAVVAKGQRAKITCFFPVQLRGGFFNPYPARSKRVSFTQTGFSRAGRPLYVHAEMVAK
jgi:hypothetical protein